MCSLWALLGCHRPASQILDLGGIVFQSEKTINWTKIVSTSSVDLYLSKKKTLVLFGNFGKKT